MSINDVIAATDPDRLRRWLASEEAAVAQGGSDLRHHVAGVTAAKLRAELARRGEALTGPPPPPKAPPPPKTPPKTPPKPPLPMCATPGCTRRAVAAPTCSRCRERAWARASPGLAGVTPADIRDGIEGYDPTVRVPTRVLAALPSLEPMVWVTHSWRLLFASGDGWVEITPWTARLPRRWDRHLDADGGLRSLIRARRASDWHRARWPTLHE